MAISWVVMGMMLEMCHTSALLLWRGGSIPAWCWGDVGDAQKMAIITAQGTIRGEMEEGMS